jgi:outer membrane protein TolC
MISGLDDDAPAVPWPVPMGIHRLLTLLLIPVLAGLAACASHYARQAEDDAGELVDETLARVRSARRTNLVVPGRIPPGERREADLPPPVVPEVISLEDALRIATERNRDYLTQVEGLELSALSVLGTRYRFTPRFSSSLAYSLSDGTGSQATQRGDFDIGVTQTLPLGGSASLTGRTGATHDDDDDDPRVDFASSVTARLSQPLLRGFGHETTYNSLTQARRDLIYSIRSFELYRQDFTIRITRAFYDLIGQKVTIENRRQNLEKSLHNRNRAREFFDVGRGTKLDMFRAEQDYLQAKDRLNQEVEAFQLRLDRFKIDLGLPLDVEFDVSVEPPVFEALDVRLADAVEAALANRLDLQTSGDRVEDSERGMRIARRELLPSLDLSAGYTATFPSDRSFLRQDPMTHGYDVGITLEIPLDRMNERNAYRQSLVSLARQKRRHRLAEDDIILEVRDSIRSLDRLEASLAIQEMALVSEKQRVEIAEIRLEEGKVGNRDLVEAQESLLDVQNDIVQLKIDYALGRLRLLRTIGTLFLDENGVPVQ